MKKFSFRLDPVLRLREHKVREEKEAFGQAVSSRLSKEEQIRLKKEYQGKILKMKAISGKAENIQAIYHHSIFIKDEIKMLEHERSQLIEIESARRIKLTEAMKNEKIITKLKEKKKDDYNIENNREETSNLDEIARNSRNDEFKL